jgi:hypothetical protein
VTWGGTASVTTEAFAIPMPRLGGKARVKIKEMTNRKLTTQGQLP